MSQTGELQEEQQRNRSSKRGVARHQEIKKELPKRCRKTNKRTGRSEGPVRSTSSDRAASPDRLTTVTSTNRRLNSLPAEQKELAEESTRFADLCQYFSQQKMDIPPSVVERSEVFPRLPVPDRIRAMKDINRELMEYLNDVGQDPGIRQ